MKADGKRRVEYIGGIEVVKLCQSPYKKYSRVSIRLDETRKP